jgi:MoaA/NifB/PqqE/SkfB family radical SAM enzyme
MSAELTSEAPVFIQQLEDNRLLKERLTRLPILLLNVHEHCNCRCLMCDIWQRKDGKELDLADFARHRDSLLRLGVQQVVLTGGEPLLHRDLGNLCNFLRECGIHITLLTTGLLLSQRAAIVAEGIDEIIVSLDGPEEVHDQVRRVKGAYRLIAEGIRAVRLRKPGMLVHGRSTVQKVNHHLLRQTVNAAKALSMNSISFLAADVTSQAFNRELIWPGERQNQIILTRQEIESLDHEVEALIRENYHDIGSRYILESQEKLKRIVRRFREQLGELAPLAPPCKAPWVSAVIEVDGSVRPCFFHRSIGSIQAQTLEQAINSEEALEFRAALDISQNPICSRCVCSLNYKPHEHLPD